MNSVIQNLLLLVVGVAFVGVLAFLGTQLMNSSQDELTKNDAIHAGTTAVNAMAAGDGAKFYIWLPKSESEVEVTCKTGGTAVTVTTASDCTLYGSQYQCLVTPPAGETDCLDGNYNLDKSNMAIKSSPNNFYYKINVLTYDSSRV